MLVLQKTSHATRCIFGLVGLLFGGDCGVLLGLLLLPGVPVLVLLSLALEQLLVLQHVLVILAPQHPLTPGSVFVLQSLSPREFLLFRLLASPPLVHTDL